MKKIINKSIIILLPLLVVLASYVSAEITISEKKESIVIDDWKPYSSSDNYNNVFCISNRSDISNHYETSNEKPVDEFLTLAYGYDAATLDSLFTKLGISYSGSGIGIKLYGGYSYTTSYNHSDITVFLYNNGTFIGTYNVQCAG